VYLRRWTAVAADSQATPGPDRDGCVQRPRYLRQRVGRVRHQQALDAVSIPSRIQELGTQGPHVVLTDPIVPEGQRSERVLDRWRFRDELRHVQPRRLQRSCGVLPCGPVYVGAGWQRGLCSCHSVHSCPVCSARIRHVRATDVDDVVRWWRTEVGGMVGMLTLTVRHALADDLRSLRTGLAACWRALWQCRHGRRLRETVAGYTRAVDVTHGPNGWHPHSHNLIYCHDEPSQQWLAELRGLWTATVRRVMGPQWAPRSDDVGAHWTPNPPRADYLCKLGLEVSSITTKGAADGHSTVWDVAREAVDEYKRDDMSRYWRGLWREWSEGMVGSRQLTWSRGLRKRAGLGIELAPEQIDLDLELHPDAPNDWIATIQPQDWRAVFGVNAPRSGWTERRRPSVLLRRTVRGLDPTLTYLSRVGLVPARTSEIEVRGRKYTLIALRQRSVLELLGRLRN
jgi:hypothetical protein